MPFVYASICSRDGKPFLSGNGGSSARLDLDAGQDVGAGAGGAGASGAGAEPKSGCLTTGEVWPCMCPNAEVSEVTGVIGPWVWRTLCPFDRL